MSELAKFLSQIFFLSLCLFVIPVYASNITISWEPKQHVEKYRVYIYKSENLNDILQQKVVVGNEAAFEILAAGKYIFKIVPIIKDEEFIPSSSTGIFYARFPAPLFISDKEKVKWIRTPENSKYSVSIERVDSKIENFTTKENYVATDKLSSGETLKVVAINSNNEKISEEGSLYINYSDINLKDYSASLSIGQNSVTSTAYNSQISTGNIKSYDSFALMLAKKFSFNFGTATLFSGYLTFNKFNKGFIPVGIEISHSLNTSFPQLVGVFAEREAFYLNYAEKDYLDSYFRYGFSYHLSFFKKVSIKIKQGIVSGKINFPEFEPAYQINNVTAAFLNYQQREFDVYDSSSQNVAIKYKTHTIKIGVNRQF